MHCTRSAAGLLAFCLVLSETISALSIKRPARSLPYTALGCYTDNANGKRALTGKSTSTDDMSVQKCATFCSQFELFGVEYGRECFCGNSQDAGSVKVDETDCSFSCAADPKGAEKCGAGDRLNLYSTSDIVTAKPATLPGITSLGCFVDSGNRVLPKGYVSSQDMTAAKCAQNCAGYKYFGTQYSSECFCGNTTPANAAPASECNMACAGNDEEICGGGMRLNVYKADTSTTPASSSTIAQTTPMVPSTVISGYEYQGCYTDNVPQRVLSGKAMTDPAMTLEKCAAFCKIGGYTWFGVEYSSECFCGTKLDALSVQGVDGACDAKCSGDASQRCGGANLLNAYKDPSLSATIQQTLGSLNGFMYKSCWTDNVNNRSLTAVDYRTDDMTAKKCSERCKDYAYFGLEYGRECYCGDAILGRTALESECSMLCMGAITEWCGGPDRLNLYAKASAADSSSSSSSSSTSTAMTPPSVSPEIGLSSSAAETLLTSITFTISDVTFATTSPTPSASATAPASQLSISSTSSTGSESSSLLPSSTLMTITSSSSSAPALTTITNCPATPTYAGTPEYCLATGKFPGACVQLTHSLVVTSMSRALNQCRSLLSVPGAPVAIPATSCFPSIPSSYVVTDRAAASSTMSSVISCLQAPTNSLMCQYASTCTTKTYTVGQEPSPTPDSGVGNELFKDGSFEDGTLGGWTQTLTGQNLTNFKPAVSGTKPHSGSYGVNVKFNNNNGAMVSWDRLIKLSPGKGYEFQAYHWVSMADPGTKCEFRLMTSQSSSWTAIIRSTPIKTWSVITFPFTTRSSLDRFTVSMTCYPQEGETKNVVAEAWFDDWTLTQMS